MIVASFYAPRPEEERKRWNCDYDNLLMATEASCRRWGLKHIVISDKPRPEPLKTHLVELPQNLMQALIWGQEDCLKSYSESILFIGADCLLAKNPEPISKFDCDIAITLGPFGDCRMNTGAIWCNNTSKCSEVWQDARISNPIHWGEDQRAIYAGVKTEAAIGLKVLELKCEDHNWAPENINDNAGFPTVVHFRGPRKDFMINWGKKFLDLEPVK